MHKHSNPSNHDAVFNPLFSQLNQCLFNLRLRLMLRRRRERIRAKTSSIRPRRRLVPRGLRSLLLVVSARLLLGLRCRRRRDLLLSH